MKQALPTLVLLTLAQFTCAESITPENIVAGKLVHGSTSPDGKYCLLEVFHDWTTQNSVIIATTDRKQNLGITPISTEWSTDRSHKGRTTIVWNSDSTLVAVHDTLPKHSTFMIFRLAGTKFESVTSPNLTSLACKEWTVGRENLVSSGELPVRWSPDNNITIQVSAKIKGGGSRTATFQVHVPKSGVPTLKIK